MKNLRQKFTVIFMLCAFVTFSQNPKVVNGVATYTANKNIGRKFKVPDSWDKIVIKKNVTITGSFYMSTRNHPIEISGESRTTSIIQGDGSRPTDDGIKGRSYSAIRCDKSPNLYVHDLKITKPMKFHIHGGFGNVTVERCDIIAGSNTHTTDGIHGGVGKTIVKDCYINCYDDALYTIECKLVENTTIVHNKNGGPFMTSWGADVPKNHVCVIRNCTVIDNYDGTNYNHGVFSWAQKSDNKEQTIHNKIEGTFTHKVNPGKKASLMYTIGRPNNAGISNAIMKMDGLCLRQNSMDTRLSKNSKVIFVNCDDSDNNQGAVCDVNDTPKATVNATYSDCEVENGTIKFTFPDNSGRTGIEFSINGGSSYFSQVKDNSGSFTVNNLAPGIYKTFSRWGNDACPTDLGTVTVQELGCNTNQCVINASTSSVPVTCNGNGSITINVSDFGSRSGIKYKLGSGNYTNTQSTSSSYTFNNLEEGTYEVFAMWGNGDCADTKIEEVIVAKSCNQNSGTPVDITDLKVENIACDEVEISWGDVNGEDAYRIRRKVSGASTFTTLGDVSSNVTSYLDNSVKENMTYIYQVRPLVAGKAVNVSNNPEVSTPTCQTPGGDCDGMLYSGNGPWKGKGRIAISSDGNEHDKDDWAATPFSLALLAAKGLQDQVTLYTFSDHIWGSNLEHNNAEAEMRESALEGGRQFGFDNTQFIEAVKTPEKAYNAMRDEINASTANNPLFIIAAGPMEVVGRALDRAQESKLKFVTVISHSNWNDNHADRPICNNKYCEPKHSGWTWKEMENRFKSKGVTFDHIVDQNGGNGYDGMRASTSKFGWLKNSSFKNDPLYKPGSWAWLYERQEAAQKQNEFDPSDAGMIIYLLTGKEKTDPSDAKKIMENPVAPCSLLAKLGTTEEATELIVFPNPTNGFSKVSEDISWELFNTSGVILDAGFGSTINMTTFPQGVYILRSNDGRVTKIIKED